MIKSQVQLNDLGTAYPNILHPYQITRSLTFYLIGSEPLLGIPETLKMFLISYALGKDMSIKSNHQ